MSRSLVALILIAVLSFGGAFDAIAQIVQAPSQKRKSPSRRLRTGCKPDTSAPQVAGDTPKTRPRKKNFLISPVPLHNSTPGAYDRLSAFAVKNTNERLGRARPTLVRKPNQTRPSTIFCVFSRERWIPLDRHEIPEMKAFGAHPPGVPAIGLSIS